MNYAYLLCAICCELDCFVCVFLFFVSRKSLTEYSAPFYLEKGTRKTRELNRCVFPNKTNGIKDVFGCSVVLSAGDLSLLQMTPLWSLELCDTKGSRWAPASSFSLCKQN